MNVRWLTLAAVLTGCPVAAWAQESSLYLQALRRTPQAPPAGSPATAVVADDLTEGRVPNRVLERTSLFAVRTKPAHQFRPHDLVTVIVREQKTYKGDSRLESETDFEFRTDIAEFFKVINGHLGAATFGDGRPNIDFTMERQLDGEGRANRSDLLSFRIAAEVIDIKPNGLLVLSAKQRIQNDEEVQLMNFTGTCRSQDVSADNTILSTQIFDQNILITHSGALRDAAKRGWLTRLVDLLSPF